MASNEIIVGAAVKIEVGITEGPAKALADILQSDPGIAVFSGAHGLAFGSFAYFDDVVGMDQINGQAFRVDDGGSPSLNNIRLTDIDTTDYSDFTSGDVIPVTAWATLVQSTQYQLGGGAAKTEDITCLIDTTQKLLSVSNPAETVTIDIRSLKEDNAALAFIRKTARKLGFCVFRVTFAGGAQRAFRGQPSRPGESVQQQATGTGQLSVTVSGNVLYLPSLS